MDRRKFLGSSGLSLGLLTTFGITSCEEAKSSEKSSTSSFDPGSWNFVRDQFALDYNQIQMAQMLLASHPKPVALEIQKHREAYDANPATYWEEHFMTAEWIVAEAAAKYMNVSPEEIALTDSTTMGTSLLFNGMKLKPGDEVIQTTHDHYVTDMSIANACSKKGATIKRIDEFKDPKTVTVEEVTSNIEKAIGPKTRVVMVTWVQSCTGVKLPISAIAEVVRKANSNRSENDRIYFAVDGVHGFGNQDDDISKMGCDFFSAGTHKWIFGPRGTGVVYGRRDAWDFIEPTIPAFSQYSYETWLEIETEAKPSFNQLMTPGGFHAFEHRWSLNKAFEFQMEIGRDRVHQRTTSLNSQLKEGLEKMDDVELLTPIDPTLSAGINCFTVGNLDTNEVVKKFHDNNVIASASPYRVSYPRLTPCVINTEAEVDQSLSVLQTIAKSA